MSPFRPFRPASRFVAAALAVLAVVWPGVGRAFCVANASNTTVHAESLSPEGYVADIAAGTQSCCKAAGCVKGGRVDLLLVTGFVPVVEGRPGWTAECRIKAGPKQTVTVRGARKHITCEASGG